MSYTAQSTNVNSLLSLINRLDSFFPLATHVNSGDKIIPLLYRVRLDWNKHIEICAFKAQEHKPGISTMAETDLCISAEQEYMVYRHLWCAPNKILFPEAYEAERPHFTNREKQMGRFSWANGIDRTSKYSIFVVTNDNPVFKLSTTLDQIENNCVSRTVIAVPISDAIVQSN